MGMNTTFMHILSIMLIRSSPPLPRRVLLALDWYDHRLHLGVVEVAAREGWMVECPALSPGAEPVPRGWRGDGVICLANRTQTIRAVAALHRRGVAVVDIGLGKGLPASVPRVVVDNAAIADLAYAHLREHGFRSLAVLGSGGVSMFDERISAFQDRAAADGLPCPHLWVEIGRGRDAWQQQAATLGRLLADLPRPVGCFAVQDAHGAEVLRAAMAAQLRVPDDVAVVGVDDQELVCLALPIALSSVDSDQYGLGQTVAVRLGQAMSHPSETAPSITRWPPKAVIIRASSDGLGTTHLGLRAAMALARKAPSCGVRALAKAAGLSIQGLDLVCRRELGEAPGHLLRRLRVAAAHRALAGGASLAEAATSAGLPSAGSLCGLFRRSVGRTPASHRLK
jgi:LacI family transcriptional regulator